ncbi:MAG: hypothetical protein ACE5JM_04995 [Armatimonadota bacterium]
MRILANALLGIGGLAFVIGVLTRLLDTLWLFYPGTYWRGAVGCAAFSMALVLMEIRDRAAQKA